MSQTSSYSSYAKLLDKPQIFIQVYTLTWKMSIERALTDVFSSCLQMYWLIHLTSPGVV